MLIRDDTVQLNGAPGIHAFIAGVSLYQHLPGGPGDEAEVSLNLHQLSSTAATAWLFYQWLLKAEKENRLPLPIATIHLLLSPSQAELDRLPDLAASTPDRCTRMSFGRDVTGWRRFARNSNDEMTLFYFAGHGVQRRQKDAVLLMDDFGQPFTGPLTNAIDIHHLINGMAPPPGMGIVAKKQVYFVDACRTPAAELTVGDWANVPDVWAPFAPASDDRSAPVFYATIPGASAFAVKGEQTLFSYALFDCLDRFASVAPLDVDADQRWRVTTLSLVQRLDEAITAVNQTQRGDQDWAPDGPNKEIVLSYLTDRPKVEVMLTLDPAIAADNFQLDIEDEIGTTLPTINPIHPNPHVLNLRAGTYRFAGRPAAGTGFQSFVRNRPVELPKCVLNVKVQ